MRKLSKLWYRFRKAIANWIPFPVEGVGFHIPRPQHKDCGEVEMVLTVQGREGTVYLSQGMWEAIGESCGWLEKSDKK